MQCAEPAALPVRDVAGRRGDRALARLHRERLRAAAAPHDRSAMLPAGQRRPGEEAP
jgi:hypothetical protein